MFTEPGAHQLYRKYSLIRRSAYKTTPRFYPYFQVFGVDPLIRRPRDSEPLTQAFYTTIYSLVCTKCQNRHSRATTMLLLGGKDTQKPVTRESQTQ